jgi:hypothetical protein
MKSQVMKPFRAPRKTGDKRGQQRRVESSEVRASSPQKVPQEATQQLSGSEEPTELGLVWSDGQKAVNPWWPEEPSNDKDVISTDKPGNGKDFMQEESPRLSDYESEGFLSRRCERALGEIPRISADKFNEGFKFLALARKRQQQEKALEAAKADQVAKVKIVRKAQADLAKATLARDKRRLQTQSDSDDDDDNVPFAALLQKVSDSPKPIRKKAAKPSWVYEPVVSTTSPYWDTLGVESVASTLQEVADDAHLTIVEVQRLDVLAAMCSGAAKVLYPKGKAALGVWVSRDFGGDLGISSGQITKVDATKRRPLYHVVYTDGTEEDYNDGELKCAIDLHVAVKTGVYSKPQSGMFFLLLLLFTIADCNPADQCLRDRQRG